MLFISWNPTLVPLITLFPMAYFGILNPWGGVKRDPLLNPEPQIVRPSKLAVIENNPSHIFWHYDVIILLSQHFFKDDSANFAQNDDIN